MKRLLMSVWDAKAKAYGPVMAYTHEAQAVRDFSQACQDPQSTLNKFPDDFELQVIGAVEDGSVVPVEGMMPQPVVSARAVLALAASGPQLAKEA